MSDRAFVLTVALDREYRVEDDCQDIINAIRMVKGVAAVQAGVSTPEEWAAEIRVRRELVDKLWNVLYPK